MAVWRLSSQGLPSLLILLSHFIIPLLRSQLRNYKMMIMMDSDANTCLVSPGTEISMCISWNVPRRSSSGRRGRVSELLSLLTWGCDSNTSLHTEHHGLSKQGDLPVSKILMVVDFIISLVVEINEQTEDERLLFLCFVSVCPATNETVCDSKTWNSWD